MYLNVLVLFCFLFQLQSRCSAMLKEDLYGTYIEELYKKGDILQGNIQFCKTHNVKSWAAMCKIVFNVLREEEAAYEEMYLHYKSFNQENSKSHMCTKKMVKIETIYFERYEIVNPDCLFDDDSYVLQSLTICFASPIVVEKNKSLMELPFYTNIAISVVPTSDERRINIMVFLKNEEDSYIPFKWITNVLFPHREPDFIPDRLFTLESPTSMRNQEELHDIVYKNLDILILNADLCTNILHEVSADMLFRLCVMVLRKSVYPNVKCIKSIFHEDTPHRLSHNIRIIVDKKEQIFNLDLYQCHIMTNTKTVYRLSHGTNENSVILYTSESEGHNKIFSPVELIENVSEEFLNQININHYITKKRKNRKCKTIF